LPLLAKENTDNNRVHVDSLEAMDEDGLEFGPCSPSSVLFVSHPSTYHESEERPATTNLQATTNYSILRVQKEESVRDLEVMEDLSTGTNMVPADHPAVTLRQYLEPTPRSPTAISRLRRSIAPSLATTALKILVVDDSAPNRKMLCRILSRKNAVCEQAEDGLVALNMVEKLISALPESDSYQIDIESAMSGNSDTRNYDIILMDYQMPNMDGPTAIKEIRNIGFKGFVLGLTGHGDESSKDRMISAGADQVMVKPLDVDIFWASLDDSNLHWNRDKNRAY
jgi:CheY-like chemotaxis protein